MVTKEELKENGFSQFKDWDSILQKKVPNLENHSMLVFFFQGDRLGIQFYHEDINVNELYGRINKWTTLTKIEEVNETFEKFCELVK